MWLSAMNDSFLKSEDQEWTWPNFSSVWQTIPIVHEKCLKSYEKATYEFYSEIKPSSNITPITQTLSQLKLYNISY